MQRTLKASLQGKSTPARKRRSRATTAVASMLGDFSPGSQAVLFEGLASKPETAEAMAAFTRKISEKELMAEGAKFPHGAFEQDAINDALRGVREEMRGMERRRAAINEVLQDDSPVHFFATPDEWERLDQAAERKEDRERVVKRS